MMFWIKLIVCTVIWIFIGYLLPITVSCFKYPSVVGWFFVIHPMGLMARVVKLFTEDLHGIPFEGLAFYIFICLILVFLCLIALVSYFTMAGAVWTIGFAGAYLVYLLGFFNSYTAACYVLIIAITVYSAVLFMFLIARLFTKYWVADDLLYYFILPIGYVLMEVLMTYDIHIIMRSVLIPLLEPLVYWSQSTMSLEVYYFIRWLLELLAVLLARLWLYIVESRPDSLHNVGTEKYRRLHYSLPYTPGDKSTNFFLLFFGLLVILLSLVAFCLYLGNGVYFDFTIFF